MLWQWAAWVTWPVVQKERKKEQTIKEWLKCGGCLSCHDATNIKMSLVIKKKPMEREQENDVIKKKGGHIWWKKRMELNGIG